MKHKETAGYHVPGNKCGGFTLLEVLVAMVIMSMALAAIFELFSANLRGITKSDDYSNAVIIAQARMRQILDENNPDERAWKEVTKDNYRIDAVVSSVANERTANLQVKLLEINLAVSWTRDSKERQLKLRTLKAVNRKI